MLKGRRILLAVNERARRGRNARAALAAALRARGHEIVDVMLDGPPGALSEAILSLRSDVDMVAIGGGDGTLLGALDGLIASRLPLAIFPLGTYNDFARTLHVPFQPARAAELVDEGVATSLDVGRVNGRHYLNEASIRIPPHVPRVHFGKLKSRRAAFAIPILLRAAAFRPTLHLEVEDEAGKRFELHVAILTIANSYRFGGFIENHEASLKDGRLWLYSVDFRNARDLFKLVEAITVARLPHGRPIVGVPGRRFMVRALDGRAHRVIADAEHVTDLPAEFTTVPNGITVLVPKLRLSEIR